MKNIKKGSTQYLILLIIIFAVIGMILYPIYDLIYYKFITNSEFVYTLQKYIIQPIVFAFIFGTVFWMIDKSK